MKICGESGGLYSGLGRPFSTVFAGQSSSNCVIILLKYVSKPSEAHHIND